LGVGLLTFSQILLRSARFGLVFAIILGVAFAEFGAIDLKPTKLVGS
jgi:Na+/glutamate symporter